MGWSCSKWQVFCLGCGRNSAKIPKGSSLEILHNVDAALHKILSCYRHSLPCRQSALGKHHKNNWDNGGISECSDLVLNGGVNIRRCLLRLQQYKLCSQQQMMGLLELPGEGRHSHLAANRDTELHSFERVGEKLSCNSHFREKVKMLKLSHNKSVNETCWRYDFIYTFWMVRQYGKKKWLSNNKNKFCPEKCFPACFP